MGKEDLIISILSIPAGHLYGKGADWLIEKLSKSEQENLNKAIKDALKRFFKDADKSKTYQWVSEKWYQDIKKDQIPLNRLVTHDGLLESLESYYPEKQKQKEKLEDAVNKILPYIVSRLIADPRATAFISELEETAQKKNEADEQAKRDAQANDTNKTVHDIKEELLRRSEFSSVSPQQQSAPDRKQTDNQDYLEHFYDFLFLEEDDDSKVTLDSMYVSPRLEGKNDSVADCVMQWFHSRARNTCMLLLGNAGVGKSSFVSKIIADANPDYHEKSSPQEFDFSQEQVLAVALREHFEDIDMEKKGDKILLDLFQGYTPDELRKKLLILDGLDEVCVLRQGFNGFMFLNKMSQLKTGFHVLVTSRDAKNYFDDPEDIIGIKIEHLRWEKDEVETWCKKYSAAKPEKDSWCREFNKEFNELNQEDHRREIFCVPIILYICGNSGVSLSDHNSVGSIYNDAFRKILLRKHLRGQGDYTDLTKADVQSNLIAWQYTKELAYQMFLLDTLDLAESDDPENPHTKGLENARSRTKAILKEKHKIDVADNALDIKKELALCPFTKSNGATGITFAHKTVYEYFTAVKLYEDYFAKFNTDFFSGHTDSANKEVIESFVEAFRYAALTPDILTFLINMDSPAFSSDRIDSLSPQKTPANRMFDKKKFLGAFVSGINENQFARLVMQYPVEEYIISDRNILEQFSLAFCNYTWFCTGLGYKNDNESRAVIEKIIRDLPFSPKIICCQGWEVLDADLSGSKLKGASMLRANLTKVDFRNSDLANAFFNGAHLIDVHFEAAHLERACFDGTCCAGVFFNYSYLLQAFFRVATLEKANFDSAWLHSAHFDEAVLPYACFINSILDEAFFNNANLKYSNFENAELNRTSFSGAHLEGARFNGCSLKDAFLEGATYDGSTIFPDDFDPEKHGMIEVDKNGNPVEK